MPERWMDHAACLDTSPDLWFPDHDQPTGNKAKAICAGCPVRRQCLEFGMDPALRDGIFGGLSADQRWKLRKKRKKAAA